MLGNKIVSVALVFFVASVAVGCKDKDTTDTGVVNEILTAVGAPFEVVEESEPSNEGLLPAYVETEPVVLTAIVEEAFTVLVVAVESPPSEGETEPLIVIETVPLDSEKVIEVKGESTLPTTDASEDVALPSLVVEETEPSLDTLVVIPPDGVEAATLLKEMKLEIAERKIAEWQEVKDELEPK
jgi:hypothetical protein